MRTMRGVLGAMTVAGVVVAYAGPSAAYRATPNNRLESRASAPNVSREVFDPSLFAAPTLVTNQWTPLVPGTKMVFDGQVVDETGAALPHQVVFIVTDLTKEIDGVASVVVWDRDFQNGVLQEEELAFEAQDAAGNVWNMGEYPEEHQDGKFSGAPSAWLSGQANAQAGLLMRADPQPGTESYLQGYAPEVEFLDEAQVSKLGEHVCPPVGCYDGTLVTDEWSPLDPLSGHQLKYYAKGVGNVQIAPVGGDARETLSLTLDLSAHRARAGRGTRRGQGPGPPRLLGRARHLRQHPSGDRPGRAHHDVAARPRTASQPKRSGGWRRRLSRSARTRRAAARRPRRRPRPRP